MKFVVFDCYIVIPLNLLVHQVTSRLEKVKFLCLHERVFVCYNFGNNNKITEFPWFNLATIRFVYFLRHLFTFCLKSLSQNDTE